MGNSPMGLNDKRVVNLIADLIPIDDAEARQERAEKIVYHLIEAVKECTHKDDAGDCNMTVDEALTEWYSKKRRMGCVAGTDWFCKRVSGFKPLSLDRYTRVGEYYGHTVATDGIIRIDLTPYADLPRDYDEAQDGNLVGTLEK
ncbi:hypothetical protein LCGC14_0534250 [marine sediment metagenome]|uniref:Uncharacterized protein n=1 Tax=marine sediment metagenome TaxID=412755 RepID=A0A0F9UG61_9ZZZZ